MFSSPISLFRAPAIRAGCSRHPSRYSARLRLRLCISRPVVHDGLERFPASRHGRAQCMPHVLSHEARPERRAVGVTRLGPDGIFIYFDLALSSHCGFFRASVRLACSLLEHPQLMRCVEHQVGATCRTNHHDGPVRQEAGS